MILLLFLDRLLLDEVLALPLLSVVGGVVAAARVVAAVLAGVLLLALLGILDYSDVPGGPGHFKSINILSEATCIVPGESCYYSFG